MSSLFYGLEIAKTGLKVSQHGISLTGHNISNANTVGYTRQRIIQNSIDPCSGKTRVSDVSKSTIGGGVAITMIDQVRSEYLDRKFRNENATLGNYNKRAEELDYIETVMDELSSTGISKSMADFFNSVSELSGDAVNDEIRTNMQQNALKMIESFHHYYNELTDLQDTYNDNMNATVIQINELLTSIATYNEQIFGYELSGEQANDLRDKRNLKLDELSGLINITYHVDSGGRLIVNCEGNELVNHTDIARLYTTANITDTVTGATDLYSISIDPIDPTAPDAAFNYTDGKLMAYKNLRDGNTSDNIGIPYILNNLNRLARSLAREFNTIHATGYTKPEGAIVSTTGVNFFDLPAGGYNDINAGNLSLSTAILTSVRNIAASSVPVGDLTAGNNEIALKLAELSSRKDLADVGNFEEFINSVVVEIGIESAKTQTLSNSQTAIVDNLSERKESVSGVSLDEEMVQMMTYQHAYAAASRVLTALDEALDVLINRTGTVGR
jgi:flagellar hook-associated protein 1 FlgK